MARRLCCACSLVVLWRSKPAPRGGARAGTGSLPGVQLAAGSGAQVLVLRAAPAARPTPPLAETHTKDRVAQPRVRTGPYGREGPARGAMPGPAAPGSGPVMGRGPSPAARARARTRVASLSVIRGASPFSLLSAPTHLTPVPISLSLNPGSHILPSSSDRVHPAHCVPAWLCRGPSLRPQVPVTLHFLPVVIPLTIDCPLWLSNFVTHSSLRNMFYVYIQCLTIDS